MVRIIHGIQLPFENSVEARMHVFFFLLHMTQYMCDVKRCECYTENADKSVSGFLS